RNVTGHWTLTGRTVQVRVTDRQGPSASRVIEGMLWQGRYGAYVRNLFSLDSTGTRMASAYWGIPDGQPDRDPGREVGAARDEAGTETGAPGRFGEKAAAEAPTPGIAGEALAGSPSTAPDAAELPAATAPGPMRAALYFQAYGKLVPAIVWPLFLVGVLAPRRVPRGAELLVAAPLLLTSVLIAGIVAIDPRTQLFMVPVIGLYAARGARWLGVRCDAFAGRIDVRKGLIPTLIALVSIGWLVVEDARRLYMSHAMETTHQLLAAENRRAGVALRGVVPEGKTVMSWHPAVAIHARREWRVLP